jgi:hypothetical protein
MMVETVTRLDRIAADEVFKADDSLPLTAASHARLSQAFARHRAASEAHTLRVAEAVREACAGMADELSRTDASGDEDATDWHYAAAAVAGEIRALDIGRIVEGVGRE